jgi:hypothetical protein
LLKSEQTINAALAHWNVFLLDTIEPIICRYDRNPQVSGRPTIQQKGAPIKFKRPTSQQTILNGEVHNWYRIVHGYSDHLVKKLIDRFDLQPGQSVIDAFCGSGTTLVECMKNGINAVGIDANPSSCFSARVKTNWNLSSDRLLELLDDVRRRQSRSLRYDHSTDETYKYLRSSGMIKRGWISEEPLRKAIAIKSSISHLRTSNPYKNVLMLALISEVVQSASNIKFGPELYCAKKKSDAQVFAGFEVRVKTIAGDLDKVTFLDAGEVKVFHGDSRDCYELLKTRAPGPYAAAICSPPYPSEHDYTRNARLELAFLEEVYDRDTLRAIKKLMVRSHTKNIYKDDSDTKLVRRYSKVVEISETLKTRTKNCTHGFGRLYPTVVTEYFGGMKRHFSSMHKLLSPGAYCAYVVGDQSSYSQVSIPTADILSTIAGKCGFRTIEIEHWRTRWSSGASKRIAENILVLRRDQRTTHHG